ncbi:MAG: hypothetical protein V4685_06715, partial [Bacteroidota bacterium]
MKSFFNRNKFERWYCINRKGIYTAMLLLASWAVVSCNDKVADRKTGSKKVEIKKENGVYRFYKNGVPMLVKGAVGHEYLRELAASGGNTVLLWDTTLMEQTLNDAARYNVSVIAGLDVPDGELTEW